jgi:hypothetical protein
MVGAWWLAQWMQSLLFGVEPHDAATFAGVAGALVVIALGTALLPAGRVLKADALSALRCE